MTLAPKPDSHSLRIWQLISVSAFTYCSFLKIPRVLARDPYPKCTIRTYMYNTYNEIMDPVISQKFLSLSLSLSLLCFLFR